MYTQIVQQTQVLELATWERSWPAATTPWHWTIWDKPPKLSAFDSSLMTR